MSYSGYRGGGGGAGAFATEQMLRDVMDFVRGISEQIRELNLKVDSMVGKVDQISEDVEDICADMFETDEQDPQSVPIGQVEDLNIDELQKPQIQRR